MLIKEIKSISSTKRDLRNFGLIIGGVLMIIGLWWLMRSRPHWLWLMLLGAIIILAGLTAPFLLKPFQKVWMIFGILMGWLMTRIILFLIFFFVFVPISILAKIFKKKLLDLDIQPKLSSYWILRQETKTSKEDLERQF